MRMGDYCTANDVVTYLGIDPTAVDLSRIEMIIAMKEDFIDRYTGHAWREKTVSEEIHHLDLTWYWRRGRPVYLEHRKIRSITGLWIWTGTEWEDWFTTKTEGEDYSVDYENGIVFIRSFYWVPGTRYSLKVAYTWGETEVPSDIKEACILLTAIDLLQTDDRYVSFASTGQTIDLRSRIDLMKEQAYEILDNRFEWRVVRI